MPEGLVVQEEMVVPEVTPDYAEEMVNQGETALN